MVRKDRELVEWQLKEKATKAQLHGLEDKVKKCRVPQASPKPPEPRKLLVESPALWESLRSLKAVGFTRDAGLHWSVKYAFLHFWKRLACYRVPCFVSLNDSQEYSALF